ncbi:MAG: hypothetical protein WC554_13015 [Clostridia bacterium]|jgi:hypothetical protein
MTPLHQKRHQELHKCLDELVSDFIREVPGAYLSKATLLELMRWSSSQANKQEESNGKQV